MQMNEICDLIKSISDGKLTLKEAKLKAEAVDINPNSFNDYYQAYRNMINGTIHTRSINSELRSLMLTRIKIYFGIEALHKALDAFEKSILYYEDKHNTHRYKDRSILDSHRASIMF